MLQVKAEAEFLVVNVWACSRWVAGPGWVRELGSGSDPHCRDWDWGLKPRGRVGQVMALDKIQ